MAEQGCLIEIESDPELDAQIIQEYAPTRLVPDRRLNRPRDSLSRFVAAPREATNDSNTNAINNDNSGSRQTGETQNVEDADEVEITGEVSLRPDGPINDEAEYINLDNYQNHPNGTIVVDHREGDDDLMLISEHITEPRRPVYLQLPAGQTLQVDASFNELPVGRSFQNQTYNSYLNPNRLRRLRRSTQSATALFLPAQNDSDDDSENDADYIPQDIINDRNQANMRRHLREQRERQMRIERMQRVADGTVEALHPNLRTLFYESRNLSEFREGLATFNFPPARLEQLMDQYRDFRARAMQHWANGRRMTRSMASPNRRSASRRGMAQYGGLNGDSRDSNLYQEMLFGLEDEDENYYNSSHEDGTNFTGGPQALQRIISNTVNRRLGNLPFGLYEDGDDAANTELIIRMIQEREERDASLRTKKLNENTKSHQQRYIDKANQLPEGYSASFSTTPMMKMTLEKEGKEEQVLVTDDVAAKTYIDIPVCALCGVELGVGIPDDFKGIAESDKGVSFEALQSRYKIHCPYQTLARPTQVDRDLSRRTYISSCGHTFCGRCQVRIKNARDISAKDKNKMKYTRGPSHPDNYGPKICPAEGCCSKLRNKGIMREVYF
ncbi:e3 ubiquitin-protein ligase complex SLX5-SLX8 subunit SLX5 [Kluyveromyces marxianus]|nr:e3 ubiquitin-protein ligase complex SLX5-SLX8 subunit SLX5 [Kluyveromyces marxianus]